MEREEAVSLVKKFVKKKNLIKHMLATGAVMKALAKKLGEDEKKWEIAGILHDIDYDMTYDKPELHGKKSVELLSDMGFKDRDILDAILAHCDKKTRITNMEKAIYAADPVTGFIVACALMHPSHSLKGLDIVFLKKRFKEKRFAQGASREQMKACRDIGLELDEFLQLSLDAMRSISSEIGL